MIGAFEAMLPRRIVFGAGKRAALPERITELLTPGGEDTLLVVTGQHPERHAVLLEALARVAPIELARADGEPTLEQADAIAEQARRARATLVLALGGGSALDLGKAVAMLAPQRGSGIDYVEVVGRGHKLATAPLPFVAVPTTSGTGSEATKNAVLSAPLPSGGRVKVSLRDDRGLAVLALVDPELTCSVPPDTTAATGLDALTQLIEPYVSHTATPFTDALVREALPRGARALVRCVRDGQDLAARTELALASLYGGLALANAKLGAVHGLAAPLGGRFDAAHGAICARLLPEVIDANLRALRERAPRSPVLTRYVEVARWLTGNLEATADDASAWARQVVRDLSIPSLSEAGMTRADVPAIAAQGLKASSMKGNPIELDQETLQTVLEAAL